MQRALGTSVGVVALASTVACGAAAPAAGTITAAQPLAQVQPSASPVVVTCEPNQRTLVRPVVVNGAALSQVECVSTGVVPTALQPTVAAPMYAPAQMRPVSYETVPARVVQSEAPARVVPARQVVYRDEVPVRTRRTRSVAKSAVIIGSTAGASAGIGALIGGKKGALIGAAVGGGGATLWDQLTRRKQN
jgi:hypothetical protein